jgi:hypothetical protein
LTEVTGRGGHLDVHTDVLAGWGGALLALAFLIAEALLWQPGVTQRDVRRIRPGMTLRQAEAIFGAPAEEEYDLAGEQGLLPGERWARLWKGGEDWAAVGFNADGTVTRCVFH